MNDRTLAVQAGRVQAKGEPTEPSDAATWMLLALIILLASAIRLYRLGAQDLWMDEVASLDNAHAFARGGIHALASFDHVAPLHSLILWVVMAFGTQDAMALRFPSLLVGVLTVPVFHILGVRLFGSRRVGLVSAALVAVSPFAVWFSQEARMYALLLLCAAIYVAVAWPVVVRSLRVSELALLALVSTVGLYTHHYMALLFCAFGLFLLARGGLVQGRAWAWLATQICAVLLFSYWMVLTADKLESPTGMSKPDMLLWPPYTLFTFLMGPSFGPSVRDLRVDGARAALLHHWFAIGVAAISTVILALTGARRALRPEMRTAGTWLLVWTIVPIALAVLATFVTNITYNVRYVITAFPPILLLLALAMSQVRLADVTGPARGSGLPPIAACATALATYVLVTCMVVSLCNLYFDSSYAKENVQPVARLLQQDGGSGILVVDNFRVVPILAYYGARLPPSALVLDNRQSDRLSDYITRTLKQAESDKPRDIQLLEYRSWESDPKNEVKSYLDVTADLVARHDWQGVSLLNYRPRTPGATDR